MPETILIIDDDPVQHRILRALLERENYHIGDAFSGEEACRIMASPQQDDIDLILLDLIMPGMDGFEVMQQFRQMGVERPVIVLTAQGTIETVVAAMQAGADDFVSKPVNPQRLFVSIRNLLKLRAAAGALRRIKRKNDDILSFGDLIAAAPAMAMPTKLGRRAARAAIPILLEGESGVGKEVFARAVQGSSARRGKAFVTVNCGAIPENLVESLLFGHEKGAFTGAETRRRGKFQEADGGTLFLDEVGELSLDIQVRLLRALQEGEIEPVGSDKPLRIDFRLISATNRSLAGLVENGCFREDLYYRLNAFPIHLPPLRERRQDIAPLAEHFLARFSLEEGRKIKPLNPEILRILTDYHWPGNVRQLENTIYRAVVLADGPVLTPAEFPLLMVSGESRMKPGQPGAAAEETKPLYPAPDPAAEPIKSSPSAADADDPDKEADRHAETAIMDDFQTLDMIEKRHIARVLADCGGRITEAARRLGIGRATLYRKMERHDLGKPASPPS